MSQEILFSDMLNHYGLKITEISDLLTEYVRITKDCTLVLSDNWKSDASVIFYERIAEIQKECRDIGLEIDKLQMLFSSIRDSELENEATELSLVIENLETND